MIGAAGSSTGRFPNGSMVRAAVGGARRSRHRGASDRRLRNLRLIAVVLIEIAAVILIGLLAQLAVLLRDAGSRAEAAVVGIGGAAAVGALAVGIALMGGIAQLATFSGAGVIPSPDRLSVSPLYRL